jgi:hypothetical protein
MSLDKNVIEDQNFLEMTYRWYEPHHKSACIFFAVWNVLSAILFHEEIVRLCAGELPVLKSAAAMILFVALFLIPTYWTLLLLLNRTIIQLTQKEMVVWHGPLPSLSQNATFPTEALRKLWLEDSYPDAEEGEGATDIIAILKNGEERKVLKHVKDAMDSEIIRDRINAWLKKSAKATRGNQKPMPPSNPMVNDAT